MAFFRTGIPAILGVVLWFGFAAGEEPAKKPAAAPAVPKIPQPVSPETLLQWLPKCPEDWQLWRSEGSTLYEAHLESHAMREYRVFRVPGKEAAVATDLMIVTIRDTCGQGPLLEPFKKETAPNAGGDFRLGRWGDYPISLVRTGREKQSLRLLIAGRFILEMVYATGNNNIRAIRPWLGACDLNGMLKAEQETRPPIRKRVLLEFVDELHPDRNRRYSVLAAPTPKAPPKDSSTASEAETETEPSSEPAVAPPPPPSAR